MASKEPSSTSLDEDSDNDISEIDIWKLPGKDFQKTCSEDRSDELKNEYLFKEKFEVQREIVAEAEAAKLSAKQKLLKRRQRKRQRKAAKKAADKEGINSAEVDEKEWQKVKPFMSAYDHIHGSVCHGKYGPKNNLEHQIDMELRNNNVERAETLSDEIAGREFGVKVSRAFAAYKATETKVKEEQEKVARKRKRLPWGFEAKERWQMKGNM